MNPQSLQTFDLNLLVSLDALLAAGNVSHAAEKLHLSQSTVSGHLAKLRAMFDDELLVRRASGRGMVLTPHAETLRALVRASLSNMQAMFGRKDAFDPATEQRTFSMAIAPPDAAALAFVSALIPRLKQRGGPDVRIAVRTVSVEAIVSEMESATIDLLVSRQELVPMALKSRLLVVEDFVMMQRRQHPRGLRPPSLAEFCELGHVVTPGPGGIPSFVDRALAEIGCERRIAVESSDHALTMSIVAATDYVAITPAHLVQNQLDRFATFAIPFALAPVQLCASWHPRWQFDPAAVWLREQLSGAAAVWNAPALAAA